jgi:hypothetical protein
MEFASLITLWNVHPTSYPMGNRDSFLGSKAPGSWSWPLTSIYCRGQRSGVIPSLPEYVFMAWCSFEAQGELYLFYLYSSFVGVVCRLQDFRRIFCTHFSSLPCVLHATPIASPLIWLPWLYFMSSTNYQARYYAVFSRLCCRPFINSEDK